MVSPGFFHQAPIHFHFSRGLWVACPQRRTPWWPGGPWSRSCMACGWAAGDGWCWSIPSQDGMMGWWAELPQSFPESVWAKASSNSGGLLYIFTCSHVHMFKSSHLHIFTSWHALVLTSSNLDIFYTFTFSHPHTLTPSHLHTLTSLYLNALTSARTNALTSSQLHICSPHIFKSGHLPNRTSSDSNIPSALSGQPSSSFTIKN